MTSGLPVGKKYSSESDDDDDDADDDDCDCDDDVMISTAVMKVGYTKTDRIGSRRRIGF